MDKDGPAKWARNKTGLPNGPKQDGLAKWPEKGATYNMTKAELLVGNVPTRDTHRFDVLVTKIGSDVITHNPARRELVDSVISSLSDEFVRPHNGEEVAILFDGVEHFLSRPNAFNLPRAPITDRRRSHGNEWLQEIPRRRGEVERGGCLGNGKSVP